MTTTGSSAASPAAKNATGLPLALVFVLCYFVFQTLLVTHMSGGAGLDDAEQLANSSYLDWGYGGSQPPLYTWVTHFATSVFGVSLLTLQMVKFSILASLFVSVFAGLRLLGFSRAVASAGMLGLFLIPQIGWESQRALTHSVASTAGCGWTFLAFAWHMRARNPLSAALLGLAMAAAMLGKFNATFFLVMVIVTGLTVAEYRRVLLSKLSIATVLTFLLCTGPTALWMLAHKSSVVARVGKLEIDASGNRLLDRAMGVWSLAESAFLFSALALGVAGVAALIHFKTRTQPTTPATAGERFLRNLILVGLALVLCGVLATGANNVKDRWLQPVLFLVPAVLAWLLARYRINERPVIGFAAAGVVAALAVPPVLAHYLVHGTHTPPYGQLDYRRLYDEIRAHGAFANIVADNQQIAGNFRLIDPSLHVVHPETPDGPARIGAHPLLVLWFGGPAPDGGLPALLAAAHIEVPATGVFSTTIAYRTKPEKSLPVSYFLVP